MANKSFSVREFEIVGNAGNSKLTSTEYIELNTPRVAISTDLTVGGTVRSDISLPAHTLTALQANITGVTTISSVNIVGVCTAASFSGSGVGLTALSAPQLTGSLPALDASLLTNTVGTITAGAGVTINQGTGTVHVSQGITYTIGGGTSGYTMIGPGVLQSSLNPTIYLHRGFVYLFNNTTGTGHPFRIQYTGTTTGYGTTWVTGDTAGTQMFVVPHDAPSTLEYQCTIHPGMKGTFIIPS